MLYSSVVISPTLSNNNGSNNQNQTTTTIVAGSTTTIMTTSVGNSILPGLNQGIPFGSGSMNLNFVVGNNLTTDNGPTNLTSQAGKTIFYDINVNSQHVQNLINTLYPSTSGLIESLGTQNSKIFFKIITDEGDYVQFVPGFILGDNILFNTSLLFNSNSATLPDLLSSLLVPSPLTFTYPIDSIFMKNPMVNQTGPNCNIYYIYDFNFPTSEGLPSCPSPVVPYMNFYLSSNFTQHKQDFDNYYNSFFQLANNTLLSFLNWDQDSSNFLPANVNRQSQYSYCIMLNNQPYCYTSYNYYEDQLTVNNNTVNLSMPYSQIQAAYYQSQFDYSANPITNQQSSSLNIANYISYPENKTTQVNFTNVQNGSKIVVIFQPSTNVYATNGVITIPTNLTTTSIDISSVAGVFSYYNYNFSLPLNQQTGVNYFTGGSFSGNTITLGTDPGALPLIVFYRNVSQPYYSFNNTLTPSTFVTSVGYHSSLQPKTDISYSVTYNCNSNGWANEIDIVANVDLNNDGVYSNNEKFNISLTYNSTMTYQVNNPLSAGDQGVYKVKNSFLNLNLSPEYSYLYSQLTGSSISNLVNSVNTLTGKKLYDYTITSTDGLLAFFKGYTYNIALPEYDPNAKSPLTLGDAFSTFNGAFYFNVTYFNNSASDLYTLFNNYSTPEITNYWVNNYGSNGNLTSSLDGNYILENTTFTDNYALLSLPATLTNAIFYRASDYNFNESPYNQTATRYSGYIYQNGTNGGFYLYTFTNYFTGPQNIIVAYQPSSSLYAINGKLFLPKSIPNINGIYLKTNYNNGTDINYFLSSNAINGTVLTINNLPGFDQVYITYSVSTWDGKPVYEKISPFNSLETINQMTLLFGFTPARSQDFFITQNNDQAINTFATNELDPLLQYIENLVNGNPNRGLFGNISLDGNLRLTYSTNSNRDITSMMNGSLNLFLPLVVHNNNIPLNIQENFNLTGSIGLWTTWKASGILKEFGITIHAQIQTAPLSQSVSTSSTTVFIKSNTTVSTSDGFIFQTFLLTSLVMVPLIFRRRKNLHKRY